MKSSYSRCMVAGLLLAVAMPSTASAAGWGRWFRGHRLLHPTQETTPAPYVVVPPAPLYPGGPPEYQPAAVPSASATAYPWGHFGAQGRRTFSWHEGYHGDAMQWRSR